MRGWLKDAWRRLVLKRLKTSGVASWNGAAVVAKDPRAMERNVLIGGAV